MCVLQRRRRWAQCVHVHLLHMLAAHYEPPISDAPMSRTQHCYFMPRKLPSIGVFQHFQHSACLSTAAQQPPACKSPPPALVTAAHVPCMTHCTVPAHARALVQHHAQHPARLWPSNPYLCLVAKSQSSCQRHCSCLCQESSWHNAHMWTMLTHFRPSQVICLQQLCPKVQQGWCMSRACCLASVWTQTLLRYARAMAAAAPGGSRPISSSAGSRAPGHRATDCSEA